MAKVDFAFSQEDTEYTLQRGDTLDAILEQYNVSKEFLLEVNGLSEEDFLQLLENAPGTTITIPMKGDIILGAPKLNPEGEILYQHEDGSVSTNEYEENSKGKKIRDLSYARGRDAYKQIAINRLTSDAPEWYSHPNMGGNLSDLIGEPNTRETADLGIERIVRALTYQDFLQPSQIMVRPIPVNHEEIMFMITLELDEGGPLKLPIIFNLSHGIQNPY